MGLLGAAFTEAMLARRDNEIVVWNRTKAKTDPLVALGATAADTPADAVRGASRVHLILLDDDAVDTTISEMMHAIDKTSVIVDHTTTLPLRTAARAAALDAEGYAYLHAPVMMGPGAARAAKGMMLVAGPSERLARVRDALTAMTGDLWYVGERPDLAAAYKLFGNAANLSFLAVIADVLHLADAAAVPREGAMQMLAKLTVSATGGVRGEMMMTENFAPQFTLDVARKDLRLMIETAGTEPTPMLRALAGRMDDLIADGYGAMDFSVIGRRETSPQ